MDAAGNVTDVKRHGRKVTGPRVPLVVTELSTPSLQVFSGQIQGMQDRALYRVDIRQCPP
jgi:hypothetical protein